MTHKKIYKFHGVKYTEKDLKDVESGILSYTSHGKKCAIVSHGRCFKTKEGHRKYEAFKHIHKLD